MTYSFSWASDRALWVWSHESFQGGSVVNDSKEELRLLKLVQQFKISTLYLDSKNLLKDPISRKNLVSFIQRSHARGLTVEFLVGQAQWAQSSFHAEVLKVYQDHLTFIRNDLNANTHDFALHFDIEPHSLVRWQNDRNQLAFEFIELYTKLRKLSVKDGLKIHMDAGFFYDQVEVQGRRLDLALMELTDLYVMMSYRSKVHGTNGILDLIKEEFSACADHKLKVAIETMPMTKDLSFITFHGHGVEPIHNALAEIERSLNSHPCFSGIVIHDYYHLRMID
jgi:hypothetical protein